MLITITATADKFIFLSSGIQLKPDESITVELDDLSISVLVDIRDNYILKNLILSLDDYNIILNKISEIDSGVLGWIDKPNGLPQLDTNRLIRSQYLPSYIDDIVKYDTRLDFPLVGELDKIYVDATSQIAYRYYDNDYFPLGKGGTSDDIVEGVTNLYFTEVRRNDLVHSVNGDKGDVFTATVEQGELADTAVQPEDLATIATTGSYTDLLNKPQYITQLGNLTPTATQVLETNSVGNLTLTPKVMTYLTQQYITGTPSYVSITPDSTTATNTSTYFINKGSGSFIVTGPTIQGGLRGASSIDLQLSRVSSTQVASGSSSVALGNTLTASGTASVAIGSNCTASGNSAVAVGTLARATANDSIAIGFNCQASAGYAIAMGAVCTAAGAYSTAMGRASTSSAAVTAFAVGGTSTSATAANSVAMGKSAAASGANSLAVGEVAAASAVGATAIGSNVTASGNYSVALGSYGNTRNIVGYTAFGGALQNQTCILTLNNSWVAGTTGRTFVLYSGGATIAAPQYSELLLNGNLRVTITGTAIITDATDTKWFSIKLCATNTTLVGPATIITEGSTNNTNTADWNITVSVVSNTVRFTAVSGTTAGKASVSLQINEHIS